MRLLVLLLVVLLGGPSLASDMLQQRAHETSKHFRADPGGYDDLFSPNFLRAVPPPQLTSIFVTYYQTLGPCLEVRQAAEGSFDFRFERGNASVKLSVDSLPPHRITGLLLGNPMPTASTLDSVIDELTRLPGTASLTVMRLGAKPERLAVLNPTRPLAVGSAFKLYLLAALIEDVEAGRRKWSDVLTLREEAKSLPSGALHEWPVGSPLTLHSLASMMISRSDNTATDHLLHLLGRERVEAIQARIGHASPDRNVPFLSTAELFKLKWGPDKAAIDAYLALGAQARRRYLGELARVPRSSVQFSGTDPLAIDRLEWFASTADLCRALDWIRTRTERGSAAPARGVLAINPGIRLDAQEWPYIGFKGGSEPGVLNLSFLLQSKTRTWYAVSASWNDPQAPLDEGKFIGLIERAVSLIER